MSSRSSRRRELPIEDSWRMVEGDHDSFDTTLLPGVSDLDDDIIPSEQPSSSFPSQPSQPPSLSQGNTSLGSHSQDSIRDFSRHQDDDQVILREPFRPSLPDSARTPDTQFRMPLVEVDTAKSASAQSPKRNVRRRTQASSQSSPSKLRDMRSMSFQDDGSGYDDSRRRSTGPFANSLPDALFDVLRWALGVITLAFRYAQKPLALLLAVYLSFGALIIAQNMVTMSISTSLSPLCRIPGASFLNLPFCPQRPSPDIPFDSMQQPVEFDDLMAVQDKFEQVLEKSSEGVSLPLEMKRSETTIRDLRTLVRHSEIQAREELVLEFDGYIDLARQSSSDLQRFNTHCGSAVDAVVAINRWTSRFIDSLDPTKDSEPLLSQWAAWFFYPFQPSETGFSERMILDKYIEHTALVSDKISTLILEAQAVLRLLTKAEDHLSLIYDISSRSSANVASRRDQIFRDLWTYLGANNAKLHNLSQQLTLLRRVDAQRSVAVKQVSALILELETIQAGLSDLRDRVAAPELLVDSATKTKSLPLSVHIETIDRGVERLETARRRISAAENDRVREALAKGGLRDEPLIEGK
ncbi:hypothetical protein V2G26_011599 [Clonostachys chloroleuca]